MKELLQMLCDYPFKASNRSRLQQLLKEVSDWDKMVNIINSHGIIALAAYNITEAGLEKEIPKKSYDILNAGLIKNIARNTWLKERWKEVNEALTKAGIRYVLLKGMALEHTIYGSRGLRQMTDLDILLDEGSAEEASNILLKSGFRTSLLKSPLFRKIQNHTGKHYPTFERDGYMIDLHVRISERSFSKEDMINCTDLVLIDGINAYVLKKDIHLNYLIDHFRMHTVNGDCQYRLLGDINLLHPETDISFPMEFVEEPKQGYKPRYRKAQYKSAIIMIPAQYRLRYLAGDIFPSLRWMKKRYGCGAAGAVLRYPLRLMKLTRLL